MKKEEILTEKQKAQKHKALNYALSCKYLSDTYSCLLPENKFCQAVKNGHYPCKKYTKKKESSKSSEIMVIDRDKGMCKYRGPHNYCILYKKTCTGKNCSLNRNKTNSSKERNSKNIIRDIFNIKNSNYQELDWTQKSPKVHVFRGELNHYVKDNGLTTYKALISNLRNSSVVYVLAFYSPKYNQFYIPYHSIEELVKRSISLKLRMDISPDFAATLQEFSKLRLYGYSAGINGLSERSRRAIIKYVIDDEIMRPYEITSHLNWLIDFHLIRTDKDFSVAIDDWKSDIEFVYDYINKKYKLPNVEIKI